MTTTLAPAFTVTTPNIGRHRPDPQPINRVADDTWVTATATIVSTQVRGTGSSLRLNLGLQADNGATTVAVIDAHRIRLIPDFLRTRGVRVQIRGVLRQLPGGCTGVPMPYIEVAEIAPAALAA